MMKEKYLLNGIVALTLGLTATSCSHDFEAYQSVQEDEYSKQFRNQLLGEQKIDKQQTWNASVATTLNVSSAAPGTIKVYMASRLSTVTAPLVTEHIKAGETIALHLARPQDVTRLYVTYFDAAGFIREQLVDVTGDNKTVIFEKEEDSAASRATTRTKDPSFNFPSATGIDEAKFLSSVPEGVSEPTSAWDGVNQPWQENMIYDAGAGVYYIENTTNAVNLNYNNSADSKLYIKGNCAPKSFYVGQNAEVYLLEGATLTLPEGGNGSEDLQGGCKYYIAKGATLQTTGELKLNNTMYLYNRGTVKAARLEVNKGSVLYNQAKVELTGEISVENSNSVIVNDGDISATRLHTAGSGHVQNNGTLTVSGATDIDSNGNTWVNNGTYTTATWNYTAGSNDVINNCLLTVTDKMTLQLGSSEKATFYVDGGVVTKDLLMDGPSRITLAGGTLFKVTGTATVGCSLDGYGIYSEATGDDYAVFQAASVEKLHQNQRREVTYSGRLIVDAATHFAQGTDGSQVNGEYYLIENGAKMANEQTDVSYTIAAEGCHPAYSHEGGSKEPTMYYFYAFEDLGATDDFDFNDVILAVTAPVDGTSEIYLAAAGGTLSTIVRLNGGQIGPEVHDAFGVGTKTMVNTTSVSKDFFKLGEAVSVTDPSSLNLSILVEGDNGSIEVAAPATGATPLLIRIPGDEQGKWFWPKERVNITEPYSRFGEWGANYTSNADWYKSPSVGVVNY